MTEILAVGLTAVGTRLFSDPPESQTMERKGVTYVRTVWVLFHDGYIALPLDSDQRISLYTESFGPETVFLAAKCSKCGSIYLLQDTEPKQTEAHERQMGMEDFYAAEFFHRCAACGLDLEVNVAFSVYAHGWFLDDYEGENCEIVGLDGLDTVLEELYELKSPSEEEENLEEWTTSPGGCVVFVEGEDDKFVVGEFLARKAGGPLRNLGVHILQGLGGGGKERAVSSAAYVANISQRVKREIPYIVVLDGDSINWAKTQTAVKSENLFLLSEKEIDSYLLDPDAIAAVLVADRDEIARRLDTTKRKGKEALEQLLVDFGVRPTAQVKQLIARNLNQVPQDFDRLMKQILARVS